MSLKRLYATLGLIAFTALTVASAVAQTPCTADQRKEVSVTAVDKDGAVLDKLRAEQLSLKVGGAPATISDLVFDARSPLDIAILIDASVSQEGVLPTAKAGARAFVASVAQAGLDRVAVVSFSDQPHYLHPLTPELSDVAQAIDQIQLDKPAGYIGGGVVMSTTGPPRSPLPGGTSLWDVVRETSTQLSGTQPEKRRRVMLLFTDGVDTSSSDKLKVIIEEALKRDVAVFAIGLSGSQNSLDEGPLKKLAEQTGGIAEFPGKKMEKLEAALTDIARHLRGRYVIGYCGGATKDRSKREFEVVDPELRKTKPVLAYKRY